MFLVVAHACYPSVKAGTQIIVPIISICSYIQDNYNIIKYITDYFSRCATTICVIDSEFDKRLSGELTAAKWKCLVSQTTRVVDRTGCPHQLLVIQQSRIEWHRNRDREFSQVLSHTELTVILCFSVLCIISIEIAPVSSPTQIQLVAVGTILMLASLLAHLKR